MNTIMPKQTKLIPISEAAKTLGVSIDTVRRWDKSGILHSERPDGKNRYFSQDELEKHKVGLSLSISEAAKKLNISTITLRRLEARDLIKPIRNRAGERVYTKDLLDEFLNSHYFLKQKRVQEKREPLPLEKLERPNLKPRSIMPHFIIITTALFLLLVTIAVGNLKLSGAKSYQPASTIASAITVPSVEPVISPEVKSEATSAAILKSQIVLVQIDDATASASVNIRQKATTDSKKIGSAKNGDTFEFVSLDVGWYEVKLNDGSTGFISAKYIAVEEPNNQ